MEGIHSATCSTSERAPQCFLLLEKSRFQWLETHFRLQTGSTDLRAEFSWGFGYDLTDFTHVPATASVVVSFWKWDWKNLSRYSYSSTKSLNTIGIFGKYQYPTKFICNLYTVMNTVFFLIIVNHRIFTINLKCLEWFLIPNSATEVSLPSDALAAVIVMDNRSIGQVSIYRKRKHASPCRRNLLFSNHATNLMIPFF